MNHDSSGPKGKVSPSKGVTTWAAVLVFAIFCASTFAQLPGSQAAKEDYSGKWSGSFEVTMPDGRVQNNTAVLILRQDGNGISGTIGESETKQSQIQDGKADGSGIRFKIAFDGGTSVMFQLHREGGHLEGVANGETPNGKMVGRIEVTRATPQRHNSESPSQALFQEISNADSALFSAFNQRDLQTVKSFFTEDLEFYHDKDGLTGFKQNMDSFKRHFESAVLVRREVVDGTLEVCALPGFGAVETGVQRFYSTEPGQQEKLTATAKFVHIWQNKTGQWKISRVISYDHR